MPNVSFVLPAYKRKFLKEAIASIVSQTYRDFEIVVVDDCSPEGLKPVVDEFDDDRIRYYRNDENIGGRDLVGAWNHAVSFARGEWGVLASDDDIYLPGFLSELMRLKEKYPSCDLFHARSSVIDATGKWTIVAEERVEFESQIQMTYRCAAERVRQQAPDFMFRISRLREMGGFVKFPLAWYSDDATWMSLSKNGCVHSADVLFCFRMSGANISSTYDNNVHEKIVASQMFLSWLQAFSGRLCPTTPEEKLYLDVLMTRTRVKVDALNRYIMANVRSTKKWWRALRRSGMPSSMQRQMLYERYPRIKALRILLPR